MAHEGRSPFGAQKSSSSLEFQEFVPPSAWTEDATCHYLLVDLPGFKKQELNLQVDNQTHIVVSGERQVRENKYTRFEQKFELPKNSDVEKITGKLDGEILYIAVPKKVEQQHQEIKHSSIPGDEMNMSDSTPASEEGEDNHKKSDSFESEKESDNKINGEEYVETKRHRTDIDENWGQEAELFLKLAMEKLKQHKGIVVTAIVAFSLGVLVTQRFQSDGH